MCSKEIEQKLKEPFSQEDIEFRIARVFKNNQRAVVLAYITSRAVMERLDEVSGVDGWKDDYKVISNGVICSLSIKVGDEWITKNDSAPFTNIEALKGGFSDSLKRAAVKFGVGRYLYKLPEHIVDFHSSKPYDVNKAKLHSYFSKGISAYWIEPKLPPWALKESEHQETPQKNITNFSDRKNEVNDSSVRYADLPRDKEGLTSLLHKFIESLQNQNALTEKKVNDYYRKINQPNVGVGLLRYFYRQFMLIDKLYSLIRIGVVNEDERVEFYKSIMTANSQKLEEIEKSLNHRAA